MTSVSSLHLFIYVFALMFLMVSSAEESLTNNLVASHHRSPSSSPSPAPSTASHHRSPSPSPSPAPGVHHVPLKRSLVAVQGVVYCKPCKFQGVGTLLGATPLSGAAVSLQCNNSIYPIREETRTDHNGYFLIQASRMLTNYGAHKCRVYLGSAPPSSPCTKPTDLHMGQSGALLMPRQSQQQPPQQSPSAPTSSPSASPAPSPSAAPTNLPSYTLYTVGPFAFDPASCPHH